MVKLELKNCKISGNFGDLDILTDAAIPETMETLVQKQPTTENKVAALDYTAFMVTTKKANVSVSSIIQSRDYMTPLSSILYMIYNISNLSF